MKKIIPEESPSYLLPTAGAQENPAFGSVLMPLSSLDLVII